MSTSVTKPSLEVCATRLAARPEGKRYRSEGDIRIQLIHDLQGRLALKQPLLSSGDLGKDERSFEEGWIAGLAALMQYFELSSPALSRDRGLFTPKPLTVFEFNCLIVALVEAGTLYAETLLGYPKLNVVRGVYYLGEGRRCLREGTCYINAVREGSKEIWVAFAFPEEGRSGGVLWDSTRQFLRYSEASSQLEGFVKTGYVHDSHEHQYRRGWQAATAEMSRLAKTSHSLKIVPPS